MAKEICHPCRGRGLVKCWLCGGSGLWLGKFSCGQCGNGLLDCVSCDGYGTRVKQNTPAITPTISIGGTPKTSIWENPKYKNASIIYSRLWKKHEQAYMFSQLNPSCSSNFRSWINGESNERIYQIQKRISNDDEYKFLLANSGGDELSAGMVRIKTWI